MESARKISSHSSYAHILRRSEFVLRHFEWALVINASAYGQRNQDICFLYADLERILPHLGMSQGRSTALLHNMVDRRRELP